MQAIHVSIQYFRPRVDGPEKEIEDAVAYSHNKFFSRNDWPVWHGGYVQIGAGYPDMVSAWYDPQITRLADTDAVDGHILAYLRSVRQARSETIAIRLRLSLEAIRARIARLERSGIVTCREEGVFAMNPAWRVILPEVVAIEAKVSNWQSALQQAIRNRIFANRSFVALPESLAQRVANMPGFTQYGVGILAVGLGGEVRIQRIARKAQPTVWSYYFNLAAVAAKDIVNRSK